MRNIVELIIDTATEFECKTGKKPRSVYLGETEVRSLRLLACKNGYSTDPRGNIRPTVNGLYVYVVDEITHVACA